MNYYGQFVEEKSAGKYTGCRYSAKRGIAGEKKAGGVEMIKIKASYECPEELKRLLDKLRPDIARWKVSQSSEGRFQKVYIVLKE